jgi:hypothetical protein
VARAAGRYTGLATGLLYRARRQFFKFAEETEISKASLSALASSLQRNVLGSGPALQETLPLHKPLGDMLPAAPSRLLPACMLASHSRTHLFPSSYTPAFV